MRIERLLLCTDGSEFSEGAIREAVRLAKRCNSRLYAVSVVEANPELETYAPALLEKTEKETRAHLEDVKARAEKEGVDCEIITHEGEEPYRYIVEEASRCKADLIVMGRRGRTGLSRLMMGSVTARVIGHAECNVLVVPRAAVFECRKILIATDGSEYSDRALHNALDLAAAYGSEVIIVSVAPDGSAIKDAEAIVERARETAAKKGIEKVATETPVGVAYEMITDAAGRNNIDLIVVGSHGRTGLKRLLMGSVAERVIGHAPCAVLVVK
ncbi:MAG: universal stress protein [Nitrospirae bacterium]|nr:universal stress protein [Nitrospirota bacterium]